MNDIYNIKFPKPILKITDITGMHFEKCRFPVQFAKRVIMYKFEGGEFINQQLHFGTFHIDIFQLDCDEPIPVEYSLDTGRIYFNFVLNGTIDFTTEKDESITKVPACTFYLSAEQAGVYRAHCNKGSTDVVIISVLPGWASKIVDNFPILYEAVNKLTFSPNRFDVLPHCRIDDTVKEWLFAILEYDLPNKVMQENLLSLHIGLALRHYEMLLLTTTMGKMFQIKLFIEREFFNPEIDIRSFSQMVLLSQQTITRRFKEEYGHSIRTFYHRTRMNYVHRLIGRENFSWQNTADKLGYADLKELRKAYNKYLRQQKK